MAIGKRQVDRIDSRVDTFKHIQTVQKYFCRCIQDLIERQRVHDQSKLVEPELPIFDEYTPKLKTSTYGSEEYKGFLEGMKVALDHHYANNSHHPEHWENGINDMSLFDVIEMVCDWMAACERHDDGDIEKSLEINQKRFGYSDELKQIMRNTVRKIKD